MEGENPKGCKFSFVNLYLGDRTQFPHIGVPTLSKHLTLISVNRYAGIVIRYLYLFICNTSRTGSPLFTHMFHSVHVHI